MAKELIPAACWPHCCCRRPCLMRPPAMPAAAEQSWHCIHLHANALAHSHHMSFLIKAPWAPAGQPAACWHATHLNRRVDGRGAPVAGSLGLHVLQRLGRAGHLGQEGVLVPLQARPVGGGAGQGERDKEEEEEDEGEGG